MTLRDGRCARLAAGGVLAAVLAAAPLAPAQLRVPGRETPAGRYHDASMDEYRAHLVALDRLVKSCAAARDLRSCDPLLVGPDDRIPLRGGRRLVRYGWLRVLFSKAEEPDQPGESGRSVKDPAGGRLRPPAPPSTSQLLDQAGVRLEYDLAQAGSARASAPGHALERARMRQVLAGRDFRSLQQPTVRDSMIERFGSWLNRLFESAARLRARSAWIGRALVSAFIALVCAGLVWGLLELERRWRVRPPPEERTPAPEAASARSWQLWLEDAGRAAAGGQWREAIHFLYWASISRLESRRLWPADRARTPREYLALVRLDDPRREPLAALTGSFEHTWYGGRAAREQDYREAERIAVSLIGPAAEGGAR